MLINWTTLILFLGALQALIVLIGINIREPFQGLRKRLISGWLVAVFLIISYYGLVLVGDLTILAYIDSLGSAAWMAIFPLFFLIAKSLTEPEWRPRWTVLCLFPVTLMFWIEGIITTLGVDFWLYQQVDYRLFLDVWMLYFFGTGILFSILTLNQAQRYPNAVFSTKIRRAAYFFLGLLIVFSIGFCFIRLRYEFSFEYILALILEGFIFVFLFHIFKRSSIPWNGQYQNNSLPNKQKEELTDRLEKVMKEQQPYLDASLSLKQLALLVSASENDLSQLLNIHFEVGFYGFINAYRLSYAEKLLRGPEAAQYKIEGIARMSGFKSKATFYRVFKQKHGRTPRAFMGEG